MCRGDMRKVSIHTHKHTHLPNLLYFQKWTSHFFPNEPNRWAAHKLHIFCI
jgi:hypothetical protein